MPGCQTVLLSDEESGLKQLSRSIVSLLFCLISTPLVRPQIQSGPKPKTTCNQDGTLCVKADVEQSVVANPLYFEVRVRCSEQIKLGWELRDDSGKVLDQDPDGRLAFLVNNKASVSERTLAVRDFALAPAKTSHGNLVLHATTYSIVGGENHPLPELSIPVRFDLRTSDVTYAVPAGDEFSDAVIASVESDPAHPISDEGRPGLAHDYAAICATGHAWRCGGRSYGSRLSRSRAVARHQLPQRTRHCSSDHHG